MKNKTILTVLALFTAIAVGWAGINTVTNMGEGTAWESFIDQLQKSPTKKDAFLAGLNGVRHVQVSLTAAQINGMYAAPVALVAAPAAGKELIITRASFKITRSATAFASGGAAIIQYGSTVNGGGTQACDSTIASTVITGSAGTTHTWRSGLTNLSDNSALDATGIYISNATGAFTTGTGTAVVDIWYVVN